ncbi:uncharacterized protein LOC143803696 [Ranitomeya variabilis]|uniref:uncharacterized protein LOC143803696 n=1 Tax=Ranitomeya variabilis TaxID=490064 RepID=UPI004057AF1A
MSLLLVSEIVFSTDIPSSTLINMTSALQKTTDTGSMGESGEISGKQPSRGRAAKGIQGKQPSRGRAAKYIQCKQPSRGRAAKSIQCKQPSRGRAAKDTQACNYVAVKIGDLCRKKEDEEPPIPYSCPMSAKAKPNELPEQNPAPEVKTTPKEDAPAQPCYLV